MQANLTIGFIVALLQYKTSSVLVTYISTLLYTYYFARPIQFSHEASKTGTYSEMDACMSLKGPTTLFTGTCSVLNTVVACPYSSAQSSYLIDHSRHTCVTKHNAFTLTCVASVAPMTGHWFITLSDAPCRGSGP
jgi:hypothetical protein